MKKISLVAGIILAAMVVQAQRPNDVDAIRSEGQLLYRLEMASWHAVDIMLRNHKEKNQDVGGYFAYQSNNLVQCIFFSRDSVPRVLANIVFDTSVNPGSAITYLNQRPFTHHENRLYKIKTQSIEKVNTDPLFEKYANTSFNFIPVADSTSGKVYVITEPEVDGVVIFGNDYLLQFDKKDSLLAQVPLHRGMVPVEFGKDTDPELIDTYHIHSKECGRFITPTDICILMLFKTHAKWKQHIVMSKSHVCAWDLETNELTIEPTNEWNKRNKHKAQVNVDLR